MPRSSTTLTNYFTRDQFAGWGKCEDFVKRFVDARRPASILEIGSGANPTLGLEYLRKHPKLKYTTNDIDLRELEKVDSRYATLPIDFTEPSLQLNEKYDLIFSRMVNEHVKSGKSYYRNIYETLKPGGSTFHFFATLYALPFVANRLMPEFASSKLLSVFAPRDDFQHAKFKAYYDWSRGPTRSMRRRFETIGFEVVRYDGYFGHNYYQKKLPLLDRLENVKSNMLVKFPLAALTSYAYVELKRPES